MLKLATTIALLLFQGGAAYAGVITRLQFWEGSEASCAARVFGAGMRVTATDSPLVFQSAPRAFQQRLRQMSSVVVSDEGRYFAAYDPATSRVTLGPIDGSKPLVLNGTFPAKDTPWVTGISDDGKMLVMSFDSTSRSVIVDTRTGRKLFQRDISDRPPDYRTYGARIELNKEGFIVVEKAHFETFTWKDGAPIPSRKIHVRTDDTDIAGDMLPLQLPKEMILKVETLPGSEDVLVTYFGPPGRIWSPYNKKSWTPLEDARTSYASSIDDENVVGDIVRNLSASQYRAPGAVSPSGKRIFLSRSQGSGLTEDHQSVIDVYSTLSNRRVYQIDLGKVSPHSIAVSPDDSLVAVAVVRQTKDPAKEFINEVLIYAPDVSSVPVATIETTVGGMETLRFSGNRTLLLGNNVQGDLRRWDLSVGP